MTEEQQAQAALQCLHKMTIPQEQTPRVLKVPFLLLVLDTQVLFPKLQHHSFALKVQSCIWQYVSLQSIFTGLRGLML